MARPRPPPPPVTKAQLNWERADSAMVNSDICIILEYSRKTREYRQLHGVHYSPSIPIYCRLDVSVNARQCLQVPRLTFRNLLLWTPSVVSE